MILSRAYRLFGIVALGATMACSADPIAGPARVATSLSVQVVGSDVLGSVGDTATLRVRISDESGEPIQAPVVWTLSNRDVVESVGDGQFRAIANGRVTITAIVNASATGVRPEQGYFASRLVDSVTVEVRQRPVGATARAFDSTFKMIGETRSLELTVVDSRGNRITAAAARPAFQSSDSTVVRVDTMGTVRTVGEGNARLVALIGSVNWATTVVVKPRIPHTSCMVYARRKRSLQQCVATELVLHATRDGAPK